ncbi:MAG TPA: hypothetical protein VMZ91_04760 [Candidatus Paceibacterota bacterium]|nr:hypothetical protein [Candidatus Paceibacterota bacterium]
MITSIATGSGRWLIIAIFFFFLWLINFTLLLFRIRQNRDLRRDRSKIFGKLVNNAAELNIIEKELKKIKNEKFK